MASKLADAIRTWTETNGIVHATIFNPEQLMQYEQKAKESALRQRHDEDKTYWIDLEDINDRNSAP